MKPKLICLIILVISSTASILLSLPPKQDETSVEIESVQIGFDGYYRVGYWCPVRVKLQTTQIPFEGKLLLEIDKNSYQLPIKIPAQARREVLFSVLIYSTEPKMVVKVYDKEFLVTSKELTALKPNEFLIGVEKGWRARFEKVFSDYSEAARYSRYFEFYPEDLPGAWQVFETIDLLVISEKTMISPSFEHLALWQKTKGGNLLVLKGSRIDLKGLNLAKPPRSPKVFGAIMPEIYQVFELPRWAGHSRQRLTELLGLYFLVSIIIFVLWLWFRHNRWQELIFWLIIIVLISGSVLTIFLYLPAQTATAENLHVVTMMPKARRPACQSRKAAGRSDASLGLPTAKMPKNTIMQRDFISVTNLQNEPVNITFYSADKFIRPLFKSAQVIGKIPLHYSLATDRLEVEQVTLSKYRSLIFEHQTIQPLEGDLSLELIGPYSERKYRIINETDFSLRDCFMLYQNQCVWIGKLPSGKTIDIKRQDLLSWEQLKRFKFNENNKQSRYQKRLLEMYLSSTPIGSQPLLIGWSETAPAEDKIIKEAKEYPTLWVILMEYFQ